MIEVSVWKKAWSLLTKREQRVSWVVLLVLIFSALASALMVASVMPFLAVLSDPELIRKTEILSWAYEKGGFASDYSFLIALALFSLLIILVTNLIQMLRVYVLARFTTMRMHTISYRLLSSYMSRNYEFFLGRHSDEMSTKVLAESAEVVGKFLRPAGEIVASGLAATAVLVFVISVNPPVALIAFSVLGGAYAIVYTAARTILSRLGELRVAANKERFRVAGEALSGIKDVKLLGREQSYVDRYSGPSEKMAKTQIVTNVFLQVPQYAMHTVAFGGVILLCLLLMDPDKLGSGQALGGILPTLGVFAFAGQRLMPELSRVYQGFAQLKTGAAAVNSVYEDLRQHQASDALRRDMPKPIQLKQDLRLDGVTYNYPNAVKAGVDDVSLTVQAGEKIGIVGGSGAGKTTLADIVLGLLRPQSGEIVIDGQVIGDADVRAWQQAVGYVPQDIFLIDASLSENIALGVARDQIDSELIEKAVRIAQLTQLVEDDLPEGVNTIIGERGSRLSGGQRQRVGIARALYHNANLIVFDEATSALDNLTEADVINAINALPHEKTIMMIAHRLSTVRRCDRIIVMEKGKIVGFDTWDALMSTNTVFQKIATASDA